jgi:hypothetical protein
MKTRIGDTLIYKLSQDDATKISRRRTNGDSIAERIKQAIWPLGAQAHIGASVAEGDELPLIVTRVGADETVNGQVLLDGNDQLWVMNIKLGTEPGTFAFKPQA